LPVRLDFVALNRTKRCLDHLLRANVSRDRITVVASRFGQPKALPVESFVQVLGLPIDHRIPDDPSAVNVAVNLGLPLVVSSPKARVTASMIRLADSLIDFPSKVNDQKPPKRRPFSLKSAASLFGLVPI
jgi:pilus assembly protein CpaE